MRSIKEMDKRLDEREQVIEQLQQAKDNLQKDYQEALDKINELQEENKELNEANNYLQNELYDLKREKTPNYYHSENVNLRRINNNYKSILTELEKWAKIEYDRYYNDKENLVFSNVEVIDFGRVLDKIQELKEKYGVGDKE